jgi:8-oxo-dGTP pyrophosphatase MutT (NUDIX family)
VVDVPAPGGFAWDPTRLAARLDAVDPLDHGATPIGEPRLDVTDLRHAAVLALILEPGEPGPEDPGGSPRILLIERSSGLRAHAGQLAFPGGKPEPGDASLAETARREAEEEVGLDREVEVRGRLDPVPTPTGFLIVPFVAFAPPGWQPRITSVEVNRLLTPSLDRLRDPSIHRVTGRGVWRGYPYELHEYAIGQPPLWGATARMVWDLLRRTT